MRPGLELAQQAAEPLEHLARRHAVERVGAQPAAQLPHDRGGVEAAAHHVPDRHAEPAVRKLEGVVPVAAELGRRGGKVAAGERHRRQLRKPRHQAALERIGEAALPLGQAARDRERRAVGGALKQLDLVVGEGAARRACRRAGRRSRPPPRAAARRAATRGPSRAGSGCRCPPLDVLDPDRPAGSRRCAPRSPFRPGCALPARPPPRAPWRPARRASCRRPRAGGSPRCRRRGCRPRASAARSGDPRAGGTRARRP